MHDELRVRTDDSKLIASTGLAWHVAGNANRRRRRKLIVGLVHILYHSLYGVHVELIMLYNASVRFQQAVVARPVEDRGCCGYNDLVHVEVSSFAPNDQVGVFSSM